MSSKFTNSQPTIEVKVNSPTANVGITDAEYNISLNPDVEADIFATKTELSAVENKIPAEYVKSAAVADNKLTLTKQDNTVVEFEGGGSYTLPVASTTTLGGVKPDETTTTVDEDGTIHAHATTPIATTTTIGSVKPDGTTITIDSNGVITANIPTKTSDLTNDSDFITTEYHDNTKQNVLIPGDNITISGNVISATGGGGGSYTLPVASTTALGGVMVGSIGPLNKGRYVSAEEDGRLFVAPPGQSSMYPGVVYPGLGLNLSGALLTLDTPTKGANGKYSIGGVKPDETTTTVDEDGTIHAHATTPIATTTTIGSVKPDGTTITIDSNGVITANIPTKTSDLTNDSDFITTEYHDSTKQNVLIPGDNITISGNVISSTGGGSELPVYPTDNGNYNLAVEINNGISTLKWIAITTVWQLPTKISNNLKLFQCATINKMNNKLEVF